MSKFFEKLKENSPIGAVFSFFAFAMFVALSTKLEETDPEKSVLFDPRRMIYVDPDILQAMRDEGKTLKYRYTNDRSMYTLGSFEEDEVRVGKTRYELRQELDNEIAGE